MASSASMLDEMKSIKKAPFSKQASDRLSCGLIIGDEETSGLDGISTELELRALVISTQLKQLLSEVDAQQSVDAIASNAKRKGRAEGKAALPSNQVCADDRQSEDEDAVAEAVAALRSTNQVCFAESAWLSALVEGAEKDAPLSVADTSASELDIASDRDVCLADASTSLAARMRALRAEAHQRTVDARAFLRCVMPFNFAEDAGTAIGHPPPTDSSWTAAAPLECTAEPYVQNRRDAQESAPHDEEEKHAQSSKKHADTKSRMEAVRRDADTGARLSKLAARDGSMDEVEREDTPVRRLPSTTELHEFYKSTEAKRTKSQGSCAIKTASSLLLALPKTLAEEQGNGPILDTCGTDDQLMHASCWRSVSFGAHRCFLPKDAWRMQYAPSLGLGIDTSAAARRLNPARNSSDEPRGERWPVFNRDGLVVDTKGGFDIDEADNSEDCDGADDDGGEVEGSQSYTDGCDERDEATGEYDETIRAADSTAHTIAPTGASRSLVVRPSDTTVFAAATHKSKRIPMIPEIQILLKSMMAPPPATSYITYSEVCRALQERGGESCDAARLNRRVLVALVFLADGYNRAVQEKNAVYQMHIRSTTGAHDAEIRFTSLRGDESLSCIDPQR